MYVGNYHSSVSAIPMMATAEGDENNQSDILLVNFARLVIKWQCKVYLRLLLTLG